MRWAEISIEVKCGAVEEVASIASDYASGGVAVMDPRLVKEACASAGLTEFELGGLNPEGPATVRFYVDEEEAELAGTLSEIRGRLDREVNCASAEKNVLSLSVRMADDREWSSWKQSFKPFRLGTRMLVTPTWEEPDALPEDIVIRIDPGQAFGTGQHATTASCAFMLERYIEGGERVLDVGTGTGILAIASVLLGADEATGVDIDSTAVKCAAENAAANRVSDRVKIVKGDMLKGMEGPYGIIVANILADPVIEIAPTAFRLLCSGGYYITAGYVLKSEEDVSKALTCAGFEIADRIQDGDWVSLAARKPTL